MNIRHVPYCVHFLFLILFFVYNFHTYLKVPHEFCLHKQEEVDRIQFTTKDTYTIVFGKKKIAKLNLRDPEPEVPEDFDAFEDVETGDYLLVRIDSVEKVKGAHYLFRQVDGEALTKVWTACPFFVSFMYMYTPVHTHAHTHLHSYNPPLSSTHTHNNTHPHTSSPMQDWEQYEEDMTLDDIIELKEDFLLFYQRLDLGAVVCKTPGQKRAESLAKKPAGKRKAEEETKEMEVTKGAPKKSAKRKTKH